MPYPSLATEMHQDLITEDLNQAFNCKCARRSTRSMCFRVVCVEKSTEGFPELTHHTTPSTLHSPTPKQICFAHFPVSMSHVAWMLGIHRKSKRGMFYKTKDHALYGHPCVPVLLCSRIDCFAIRESPRISQTH